MIVAFSIYSKDHFSAHFPIPLTCLCCFVIEVHVHKVFVIDFNNDSSDALK